MASCTPWTPSCLDGSTYESTPPSPSTDRTCSPCSNCGEFLARAAVCMTSADTKCVTTPGFRAALHHDVHIQHDDWHSIHGEGLWVTESLVPNLFNQGDAFDTTTGGFFNAPVAGFVAGHVGIMEGCRLVPVRSMAYVYIYVYIYT